jgi:hypothetical protein
MKIKATPRRGRIFQSLGLVRLQITVQPLENRTGRTCSHKRPSSLALLQRRLCAHDTSELSRQSLAIAKPMPGGEWKSYGKGQFFVVPPHVKFEVEAAGDVAYLCFYKR